MSIRRASGDRSRSRNSNSKTTRTSKKPLFRKTVTDVEFDLMPLLINHADHEINLNAFENKKGWFYLTRGMDELNRYEGVHLASMRNSQDIRDHIDLRTNKYKNQVTGYVPMIGVYVEQPVYEPRRADGIKYGRTQVTVVNYNGEDGNPHKTLYTFKTESEYNIFKHELTEMVKLLPRTKKKHWQPHPDDPALNIDHYRTDEAYESLDEFNY